MVLGLLTLNQIIGGPTDARGFLHTIWQLASTVVAHHSGEYMEQFPDTISTLNAHNKGTLSTSMGRIAQSLFFTHDMWPRTPDDPRVRDLNNWLAQLFVAGVDNKVRVADEARLDAPTNPNTQDDSSGSATLS